MKTKPFPIMAAVLILMTLILTAAGCIQKPGPHNGGEYALPAAGAAMYRYTVGSLNTNCHFLCNSETKGTVIIDPGDDAPFLREKIQENELKPEAILLTHGHGDHIAAAEELRETFDIPVYAWAGEKANFGGAGVTKNIIWLDGEDDLSIAGFSIKVMHTPGHTVGSVCYYIENLNLLFSGDTMFRESYGRTDFPTGDVSAMIRSFEVLFALPDETAVFPGHGGDTTIAYERENNPVNQIMVDAR